MTPRENLLRTARASDACDGYLCSTVHMIRPEAPRDKMLALVETVREFGHP